MLSIFTHTFIYYQFLRTVLSSLLLLSVNFVEEKEEQPFMFPKTLSKEVSALDENGDIPFLVSLTTSEYQTFDENNINIVFQKEINEQFSFQHESESLEVTYTENKNQITFHVNNIGYGYSKFDIKFFVKESIPQTFRLHFYKKSKKVFFSSLSKDTVIRYAYGDTESNNDNQNVYISKTISTFSTPEQVVYPTNTNVFFRWKDKSGNSYPVVGFETKLYFGNTFSSPIQPPSVYLESDGHLGWNFTKPDLSFTGAQKATVQLLTRTKNLNTFHKSSDEKNDITYSLYFTFTFFTNNIFTIDMDSDFGKAVQITQAAHYYSEYYKNISKKAEIPTCNILFPANQSNCNFIKKKTLINITAQSGFDNLEAYESWDTIGHEYGHYIEAQHPHWEDISGTHNSGRNDMDTYGKWDGAILSFKESWPTYFAITAQESFPSNIKNNVKTVGNDKYEAYNFYKENYYSLKEIYDSEHSGDGCERTLMNIFYNLYDKDTDEYDKFTLGDEYLWDIFIKLKQLTLSDFISALYQKNIDKDRLGLLLERTHVCAENINIICYVVTKVKNFFQRIRNPYMFDLSDTIYGVFPGSGNFR